MKTQVNKKTATDSALSGRSLLTALLLLAAACPVWAGKGNLDNPGVMPPQSHAFGMAYGEWAMEFFNWFQSIPGAIHPSYDTTGEYAAVGQEGKVWFLCGYNGGDAIPVERHCTIPSGKSIFLQVQCTFWTTLPIDLEIGVPTDEEIFAFLREVEDTTSDLACVIDGRLIRNLENYRCQTPAFSFTFPDLAPGETWWDYGWPEEDWLVPSGGWVSTPSMSDGYAVLLAPLSVGEHTIHFTSSNAYWGDSQDVTYVITVK
jgi:hypothetical protein